MSTDQPSGASAGTGPDPSEPAGVPRRSAGPSSRRWRRKPQEKKKGSLLKELPVLLVVAFVLALVIKTFLVQAFFIPSGSMEPTLHGCPGCPGDRVLVNKVPYYFHTPEPGDIVVFRGPESWAPEFQAGEPGNAVEAALLWLGRAIGTAPPDEKDFVKRVVATGGQTVECCDDQGRVMVDGEALDEPYIEYDNPVGGRTFGPITVPEGRLWVMGDNRAGSADSRSHLDDGNFGTIPVDNVIGRATVIVWPVSRLDWLGSPDIQAMAAPNAVPTGMPALVPSGSVGLALAVPLLIWRRRPG
jgi:signal peptidase I